MKLSRRDHPDEQIEIGAIYAAGDNYRDPAHPDAPGPARPLIYGKVTSSLTPNGSTVAWDRSLTEHVVGECELGVILGADRSIVGYTIVNDMGSRDEWLDGDQYLLGKSLPGFCPVGPWYVPTDEFDPTDVSLRFSVNGTTVQDGRTTDMRYSIAELIEYLGRHVALNRGDLISTGTPVRSGPMASSYLQPGDVMICSIEGIGELTTTIA